MSIIAFDNHRNVFSVERSGKRSLLKAADMEYKWPQINHRIHGENLVMLVACDDAWIL